jgi:hypothetical protein
MKLGVFGDSFCERKADHADIWFNFLRSNHGHQVDCFGEGGSSILFSAQLIEQKAKDYDLIVWALTTPGRFSFTVPGETYSYHVNSAFTPVHTNNPDLKLKHQACTDYLKYVFDWEQENFISRAIVKYIIDQHKNVMIVPCFPPPMNAEFNLYTMSEKEAQFYFPNLTIPEIYQEYHDLRLGHIGRDNQVVLADLVNKNLGPGLFQASYDEFVNPTQPVSQMFVRKK